MENQFKMLRIFGILFKVVAWGALLFGLIGTVTVIMGGGSPSQPRSVAVVVLLVSMLYFMIFYTVSEIIKVLLHLVENTKK